MKSPLYLPTFLVSVFLFIFFGFSAHALSGAAAVSPPPDILTVASLAASKGEKCSK